MHQLTSEASQRLRRKFLPFASPFSLARITQSPMRLDVGSDSVSSGTAKKSAQRGLTASNEQFAAEGGQWFRQNTMHYLNFKSPSKCRLNSPVSFSLPPAARGRKPRESDKRDPHTCVDTCVRTCAWCARSFVEIFFLFLYSWNN